MLKLSRENFEILHNELLEAFTIEEMQQLLRFKYATFSSLLVPVRYGAYLENVRVNRDVCQARKRSETV